MGVNGLLQATREAGSPTDAMKLSGQTLAVDGHGWLHKSIMTCAEDLLLGRPTTKYLEYVDKRIRALEACGVKLFFVFDGAPLPMKARIEAQRAATRQAARERLSSPPSAKYTSRERWRDMQRSVSIDPEMVAATCAYLRARGIPCVVAPYEADPQLVYLESRGLVDGIISEDSDLLVFGAQRLLTKGDLEGRFVEVRSDLMAGALGLHPGCDLNANLRALAIISGCDYSSGVQGLGITKTKKLLREHRSLDALLNWLDCEGRLPQGFLDVAQRAELAFQYQYVWDPISKTRVPLNDTVPLGVDPEVVGDAGRADLARAMAEARRHPLTGVPLPVPPHAMRWIGARTAQAPRHPLALVNRAPSLPNILGKRCAKHLDTSGSEVSKFWNRAKIFKTENSETRPLAALDVNRLPAKSDANELLKKTTPKYLAKSLQAGESIANANLAIANENDSTETETEVARPVTALSLRRYAYSQRDV